MLFISVESIGREHENKQILDTMMLLLESGFNVECLMENQEQIT